MDMVSLHGSVLEIDENNEVKVDESGKRVKKC